MADNLEIKIPIQFRDKKKLNQLHIKMNHLREEIYRSKAQVHKKVIYTT